MTKTDVYRNYRKGYVEVTMDEWMDIFRAFEGKMVSPGSVAERFGITRQAVLKAARCGRIYYFTVTKPRRERGFVLIPVEGLEDGFERRSAKAV